MDITIKVDKRDGTRISHTFIGEKEDILKPMQKYIKENENYQIDILFQNNEDVQAFTHDELFNP